MSNKLPLVSIIVPCYNHEKYVQETIESIVHQTYKNIELIVIDDGSKDTSPQVIERLSKKYNFTFIHRPNKGLSATLNEGIALSKGEYIAVCASDDIFMTDKIEKQVAFMNQNTDYGICYSKTIAFDNFGNTIKNNPKNAKSGWVFKDLIYQNFTMPAPTCMYRKKIFDVVGRFDESLFVEDWDIYLRIADKYQVGFQNEYFVYYRTHDTNISKQRAKIFESQKNILDKWKTSPYYKKAMILWRLKWYRIHASHNKPEAVKYFFKEMPYFYHPRFIKGTIELIFMGWK